MSIVFNVRDPLIQTELGTNHRFWTFSGHSSLLALSHPGSWWKLVRPRITILLLASNSPSEFMPVVFVWLTNYLLFVSQKLGDSKKAPGFIVIYYIYYICYIYSCAHVWGCVCVCVVLCCVLVGVISLLQPCDFPGLIFQVVRLGRKSLYSLKPPCQFWVLILFSIFLAYFFKTIFKDIRK